MSGSGDATKEHSSQGDKRPRAGPSNRQAVESDEDDGDDGTQHAAKNADVTSKLPEMKRDMEEQGLEGAHLGPVGLEGCEDEESEEDDEGEDEPAGGPRYCSWPKVKWEDQLQWTDKGKGTRAYKGAGAGAGKGAGEAGRVRTQGEMDAGGTVGGAEKGGKDRPAKRRRTDADADGGDGDGSGGARGKRPRGAAPQPKAKAQAQVAQAHATPAGAGPSGPARSFASSTGTAACVAALMHMFGQPGQAAADGLEPQGAVGVAAAAAMLVCRMTAAKTAANAAAPAFAVLANGLATTKADIQAKIETAEAAVSTAAQAAEDQRGPAEAARGAAAEAVTVAKTKAEEAEEAAESASVKKQSMQSGLDLLLANDADNAVVVDLLTTSVTEASAAKKTRQEERGVAKEELTAAEAALGALEPLTDDVESFYAQADPTKPNQCLYGYPDGSWAVDAPPDEVPAEVPEPALGINFARDGMQRKDWLGLVAVHSDSWLISLAFYKGARLDAEERNELFALINKQPTVYEVVSGRVQVKPTGAKKAAVKQPEPEPMEEEEEDEYEDGEGDPCPQCGKLYSSNEFWIACDFCDAWYCGRCAKMTEQKAQTVENWKCQGCTGGA
ncbi:hypothetical protein FOA52_006203 [Chlamydomonas sp. UWO 241]|nr:hypothetical protein FOA52_006203 [Chlamydomonas sp. UWO 241]